MMCQKLKFNIFDVFTNLRYCEKWQALKANILPKMEKDL